MKNIDGKDVERPISPHLQIYKPQITSVLSISHRLSGIFLGLGLVFSVFYVFFLALGEQSYTIWQCFSNKSGRGWQKQLLEVVLGCLK